MADLSQFNINAADNSAPSYELLPKGYYRSVALKEELKQTKDGTGSYIAIEFEVLQSKRKLFANYNIVNKNPKAQEVSLKDLQSFAWAVGLPALRDSAELMFKEVNLYVNIKPEENGYKAANTVKGYYPAQWSEAQIEAHRKGKSGASSSVPPVAATNAPVGATVGASPWARK